MNPRKREQRNRRPKTSSAHDSIVQPRKRNANLVGQIMASNKRIRSALQPPKGLPAEERLTDSPELMVYPQEVVLRDIEAHQVYEVSILIRNLTRSLKRIKITQPASSKFRCDYDAQGPLAPGLTMELFVSFFTNRLENYYDEITVVSDDQQYKIPLNVYAPVADLKFEGYLNFNFQDLNSTLSRTVSIENVGTQEGKVELRYEETSHIVIAPQGQVKIRPGEIQDFKIDFSALSAGIFRGVIEVIVDSVPFVRNIDVNATIVEQVKLIIDKDGNSVEDIDFGDLFFGQKKEMRTFLINNSPQAFKFNVKFLKGLHKQYDDAENLKTPIETGLEQTERVMDVFPSSGTVEAYSQIPVTFMCKSSVSPDQKLWVKNNAYVAEVEEFDARQRQLSISPRRFASRTSHIVNDMQQLDIFEKRNEYSARFDFSGAREQIVILMTSKICAPSIKFRENKINFGDCPINSRRDFQLTLYNESSGLPVLLEAVNISHFRVAPKRLKVEPQEVKKVVVTFKPKQLGRFKRTLTFLVNGEYEVPIKVVGNGSGEVTRKKKLRGLSANKAHFNETKKMIADRSANYVGPEKLQRLHNLMNTTKESGLPLIYDQTGQTANLDNLQIAAFNKKKFNNFLKDARQQRLSKKKKDFKVNHRRGVQDRLRLYSAAGERELAKERGKAPQPFNDALREPVLDLPPATEGLFVNKPILHYEPYSKVTSTSAFNPDPFTRLRVFTDKTFSTTEKRECRMVLSGQDLQKIQVGPIKLDFGAIFVKSVEKRYFQIKNDLRTSIRVQLEVKHERLSQSYGKSQILPSGSTGSFEVVLSSPFEMPQFSESVTYIINEKHYFNFLVEACITKVKLRLDRFQEDFSFLDDSLTMQTSKTVDIFNDGNDTAFFEWLEPAPNCNYSVRPLKGSVVRGGCQTVTITFDPRGQTKNVEEEVLTMMVRDGNPQQLNCRARMADADCRFLEGRADFGIIAIHQPEKMTVSLKNMSPKNWAIFKIEEASLPDGLSIKKMRDKIAPEEICEIELEYVSKASKKIEDHEIVVRLRGAEPLTLLLTVETIVPNINIMEETFDFGDVTFGNTSHLEMTIQNLSPIDAILNLDLRENEKDPNSDGYNKLSITSTPKKGEDSHVLEEKELDDLEGDIGKEQGSEDGLDNSAEEAEEDIYAAQRNASERSRFYLLKIKKETTVSLRLTFCPKEQKFYSFNLPLTLNGSSLQIDGILRRVTCRGQTPKLIIDPVDGVVNFPKRIINNSDSVQPSFMIITLTNMNHEDRIPFFIEDSDLDEEGVFTVEPSKGVIDFQSPVTLKIKFQPRVCRQFESKLPLYLDSNDKPYTVLTLRGEGAYPRILFDRREVIMPIVPLGIESICTFHIYNEGYQKMDIDLNIPSNLGSVNLKVSTPDGNQLSVTKDKIKVRCSFVARKPISFTSKISFEDKVKNVYTIFVSGTTDNCLLTNFPFFQTSPSDYDVVKRPGRPLTLQERQVELMDYEPGEAGRHNLRSLSQKSHSLRSTFGFRPIPIHHLEQYAAHIKDWLNEFVLSNNNIDKFPEDVIASGGAQLFDLLQFLCKKPPLDSRALFEQASKKVEKVSALHEQYRRVVYFLKENGAMLNTIRPEFLLSLSDLNTYYKLNPMVYVTPASNKMSEKKFRYISLDSWSVLFYQIIKVFYLCRVQPKNFKLKVRQEMGDQVAVFPEGYLDSCPVYSHPEVVILRWLELFREEVYGLEGRLANFDVDMMDGLALGAVLQNYIGSGRKELFYLRKKVMTEDDALINLSKVKESFVSNGIMAMPANQTQKQSPKPSAREMLLFLVHLYQILPNYKPKTTLLFKVTLDSICTHTIMLENPGKMPIYYWADLDCDRDFSIDQNEIKLDPESSAPFLVHYNAKISKKVRGRLTFRNKRQSGIQASALVFDLESQVTDRVSIKKIRMPEAVPLYEGCNFEVVVENPYDAQVTFQIGVENQKVLKEAKSEHSRSLRRNKKRKRSTAATKKTENTRELTGQPVSSSKMFVPAFFSKTESITIPKKASAKLVVYYLPISLESHKCNIIFTDEKVGEMQYEVQASPTLPAAFEKAAIVLETHLDNSEPKELVIKPRNKRYLDAVKRLEGCLDLCGSFDKQVALKNTIDKLREDTPYNVICSEAFLRLPSTFKVTRDPRLDQAWEERSNSKMGATAPLIDIQNATGSHAGETYGTGLDKMEAKNKMMVHFNYKFPVSNQQVKLLLQNDDLTDIRVYDLLVNVKPRKVSALLELVCPARISVEQEIPILNSLKEVTEIEVELSYPGEGGDGTTTTTGGNGNGGIGGVFSVPEVDSKGIYQASSGRQNLKLVFSPDWIGEYSGNLKIVNKETSEIFEFELKGVAEEPLAVKEIELKMKVRTQQEVEIELTNHTEEFVTYQVDIDLQYSEGPASFGLRPKETGKYRLKLSPNIGGEFIGSVTFTDPKGEYYWYIVTMRVESSKSCKQLYLQSHTRKHLTEFLEIQNSHSEPITYQVSIIAKYLSGAQTFTVPALSSNKYKLSYSPLGVYREKGSVTFTNSIYGEVIYELFLTSEDAPLKMLPMMREELGKVTSQTVKITNPVDKELKVTTKCSNLSNFRIEKDWFKLPPKSTVPCKIFYIPSSLESQETSVLIFETQEVGSWTFQANGIGLLPTESPPFQIDGCLESETNSTIAFKNPFKETITVQISLTPENEQDSEVFELMLKKTKLSIAGFTTIELPICFRPQEMSSYQATMVVQMTDRIKWKFPINAVTESVSQKKPILFKVRCGEAHSQRIELPLQGVVDIDEDEIFKLEVDVKSKELARAVKHWLVFEPIKSQISGPEESLVFDVKFAPTKPFKAVADLVVNKPRHGGHWRFKIQMVSLTPSPLDTIELAAPLHTKTKIKFQLGIAEEESEEQQFVARFVSDSAPEFEVSPKTGYFSTDPKKLQEFQISYLPKHYGKIKTGKLEIQTEKQYWSYIVKGTFPKEKILSQASKIDNKLDPKLARLLGNSKYRGQNKRRQSKIIQGWCLLVTIIGVVGGQW